MKLRLSLLNVYLVVPVLGKSQISQTMTDSSPCHYEKSGTYSTAISRHVYICVSSYKSPGGFCLRDVGGEQHTVW